MGIFDDRSAGHFGPVPGGQGLFGYGDCGVFWDRPKFARRVFDETRLWEFWSAARLGFVAVINAARLGFVAVIDADRLGFVAVIDAASCAFADHARADRSCFENVVLSCLSH